jgi:hypothetical protein
LQIKIPENYVCKDLVDISITVDQLQRRFGEMTCGEMKIRGIVRILTQRHDFKRHGSFQDLNAQLCEKIQDLSEV